MAKFVHLKKTNIFHCSNKYRSSRYGSSMKLRRKRFVSNASAPTADGEDLQAQDVAHN